MEKLQWETKKVKVKDPIQLDINPRKISEAQKQKLVESLERFNLVEIPAVNTDMQIIGGNQRVTALMLIGRGDEEIDVRMPSRTLTKSEIKEYCLISNTHAGEFDLEILENQFADIEIDKIGFDVARWDDWKRERDNAFAAKAHEDEFDVPVGGSETDIVEGDIFDIGQHRLLCGDCTMNDNWKRLMGQEMADLVITDPPYNIDYVGRTKERLKIDNDKQTDSDFCQFMLNFFTGLASFTRDGGAWYVWHDTKQGAILSQAFIAAGIMLKQSLVWVKHRMLFGYSDYQLRHEACLYGWKKGAAHHWYSDRKQTTVLNFDRPIRNAEHPTMKPVKLIAYLMGNSSKADDIVCDGFGGSGTTMIAAHQLNRRCRMMEIDPRYCQVIIDRMKKFDPTIKITKNGQSYE